MMLDGGFEPCQALVDCIKASQFRLCITLMAKLLDDSVIRKSDAQKRTLFHHLAKRASSSSNQEDAMALAAKLGDRGVPAISADALGRTPLHYACKRLSQNLVLHFLGCKGADINLLDKQGKSPLIYLLEGDSNHHNRNVITLVTHLLNAGADANLQYADPTYNVSLQKKKKKNKKKQHQQQQEGKEKEKEGMEEDLEKTTLLIHAVRLENEKLVELLVQHKASPNATDSKGFTPLIHAVRANDIEMVDLLLKKCQPQAQPQKGRGKGKGKGKAKEDDGSLDLNAQDEEGRTVIHHAIAPMDVASFENVPLLKKLAEAGADLHIKDNAGHTPAYYACLQNSGKMLAALRELGVKVDEEFTAKNPRPVRQDTSFNLKDLVGLKVDYHADAEEYIKNPPPIKEDKKKSKVKLGPDGLKVIEVDENFEGHETSEVHVGPDGAIYDCMLTKVDVKSGTYGINNFYKMQVIHNIVQDLYILWNRWGRIGQQGQFQRTPFPSAEDAVTEFCKIFKAKTGNVWKDKDNFEKKPKKYSLMKIDRTNRSVSDLLTPFELPYLEDDEDEGKRSWWEDPEVVKERKQRRRS